MPDIKDRRIAYGIMNLFMKTLVEHARLVNDGGGGKVYSIVVDDVMMTEWREAPPMHEMTNEEIDAWFCKFGHLALIQNQMVIEDKKGVDGG